MGNLSKLIKYGLYLLIFSVCINVVVQYIGKENKRFPIELWYVYSESMEPVLMTNDGFILIKSSDYKVNDVITFKPKVLTQPYVTHRIIRITEEGLYITKGDNNAISDQQGGEPLIDKKQIMGKALTLNRKLVVIPQLGLISNKLNTGVKEMNIFMLAFIGIIFILLDFIIDNLFKKQKTSKKKKYRLLDIAPYFDHIFWLLCFIVITSGLLMGTTLKSWDFDKVSYVVVATKGLPSPIPGEGFYREVDLENKSFLPFLIVLESKNTNIDINPAKLVLAPKSNSNYKLSLIAPNKTGYYTEEIMKRSYPNVLPSNLFDVLYFKNKYLPLIIIFLPIIILITIVYKLWLDRWNIGRRKVMPWLISFRRTLRKLS